MIAPLFAGLAVFSLYPFFLNLYYSFTDLGSMNEYSFVGLENYKNLLSDEFTFRSLLNTAKYIVVVVPTVLALSLAAALLLNRKIRFKNLYRVLIFLPAVTMPVSNAMVWKWLYNREYGVFNFLLAKIGIEPISWLGDERFVFASCCLVLVWSGIALNMVIFLAGLQDIPESLYEAAKIDGSTALQSFFHVTLPLLSPTIFFLLVINIIGMSQVFDEIYMLLGTRNLVEDKAASAIFGFYKHAFVSFDQGYAATIAVVVFLFTLVLTLIQLRLQKRWVHYESK